MREWEKPTDRQTDGDLLKINEINLMWGRNKEIN